MTILPNKAEKYRVRLTVGDDRLEYIVITKTDCASLITVKILLSSTISTPNAKFGTIDVSAFYYGTKMPIYEYVQIALKEMPSEIAKQYDLNNIAKNGYVHCEIRKGMPGLNLAGKIAHDLLRENLEADVYYLVPHTPEIWKHKTRPISFCLVVDDFGVKYVGDEHFEHLRQVLKKNIYHNTTDYTGSKYIGLTIDWD